jgi:hypothetical protein
MRPPVVITSRGGRIGTAVLGAAALGLLVWDATVTGLIQALLHAPFVMLFVWLAWLFWGLASIRIDNDGVHVINQLRVWDVGWASLEGVSGRWGLTLTIAADALADGHAPRTRAVRAWAAPARGSIQKFARSAPEVPVVPDAGDQAVRTSLDSFSAARLIEIEQVQRTSDDRIRSDSVRVRPNWTTIIITVVLVGLSFLA